jgi:excisionase family DNA binding protein
MQRNANRQNADHGSTNPRRFMDTRQTAQYLGISASTLTKWRMVGRGPRYFNFGSLVRYATEDVDAYIESARAASPSTAA